MLPEPVLIGQQQRIRMSIQKLEDSGIFMYLTFTLNFSISMHTIMYNNPNKEEVV